MGAFGQIGSKLWSNRALSSTLIGAGTGAAIGGIYGASNKEDKLSGWGGAAIGAGLGAGIGYGSGALGMKVGEQKYKKEFRNKITDVYSSLLNDSGTVDTLQFNMKSADLARDLAKKHRIVDSKFTDSFRETFQRGFWE